MSRPSNNVSSPSHRPAACGRQSAAFTLIEILVALAIMAIVVGCAYGLFVGATKSAARYRARTDVERDARALLRMMGREVRCSYFPSPSEAPATQSSPAGTTGAPGSPSPASAVQPSAAGTSGLALTPGLTVAPGLTVTPGLTLPPSKTPGATVTTAMPSKDRPVYDYLAGPGGRDGSFLQTLTTGGIADPDRPSSGLYNVGYRLDAARKMIFRRQVDMLEPLDSPAQDSSWLCVARGVESVKCSFFDGQAWQDSWQTSQGGGLPCAVKIEIELADAEGRISEYSTSISVALAVVPPSPSQLQLAAPTAH